MISMSNEKNIVEENTVENGRYKVTKRDLKRTAARYNFMACNIFNYESQMGPAIALSLIHI